MVVNYMVMYSSRLPLLHICLVENCPVLLSVCPHPLNTFALGQQLALNGDYDLAAITLLKLIRR